MIESWWRSAYADGGWRYSGSALYNASFLDTVLLNTFKYEIKYEEKSSQMTKNKQKNQIKI